jgi:hypothetical protein
MSHHETNQFNSLRRSLVNINTYKLVVRAHALLKHFIQQQTIEGRDMSESIFCAHVCPE